MDGVINGFSEMLPSQKKGLKDIIDSPLIRELYTWSRGVDGGSHISMGKNSGKKLRT